MVPLETRHATLVQQSHILGGMLHPMPTSTHSSLFSNSRRQLMVLRIRSLFIQDLKRLSIQFHIFALETNVVDSCDIVPIIVFDKKCQVVRVPKLRSLDL